MSGRRKNWRVLLNDEVELPGDYFAYTIGALEDGTHDPGTLRTRYGHEVKPPWKIQYEQANGSWITMVSRSSDEWLTR